jgi:hypothetical protein
MFRTSKPQHRQETPHNREYRSLVPLFYPLVHRRGNGIVRIAGLEAVPGRRNGGDNL